MRRQSSCSVGRLCESLLADMTSLTAPAIKWRRVRGSWQQVRAEGRTVIYLNFDKA